MPSHARMLALSVGALALAVAGCATVPDGSIEAAAVECPPESDCYDPPRAVGDGGSISVEAGEFFFNEPEGVFWEGDIEVTIVNTGAAEHDITFIGANEGSSVPFAAGGDSDTQVVNLFAGDVVYYCSIPGHRAQGMEAVLTVHATQEEAEEALSAEQPADDADEGATDDAGDGDDADTNGDDEDDADADDEDDA